MMCKGGIVIATLFTAMVGAGGASAQTTTDTRQPYFAPKRVLLLSATKPYNKTKFPAAELAVATLQSLRNQFFAPQYRSVSEPETKAALKNAAEGRLASNASIRPENPVWLAERSPAETTAALIAAGKAVGADTAVFVVVQEASRLYVTLTLWKVDVRTGIAIAEGKTLTRREDHYTRTHLSSDRCREPDQSMDWKFDTPEQSLRDETRRVNLSPSLDENRTTVTVIPPRMDDSLKKLLISRMLTEWITTLYK
ncbi:MAG: hypothetical protein H7145_08830 [Akkermansiaceae bacterium]|nr:hypothetical protein [Armatimonadota bacterium]